MKAIREELHYPGSPAVVFEVAFTGSFQLELIAELGGLDPEVIEETATDNGGLRLVTAQRTHVELPLFVRRIMPADTTVTQTYEWSPPAGDGSRTGTWSAEIKGAPIRLDGTTELRANDGGTTHVYLGGAKASVPIVGGRLESFAVQNLRQDLTRGAKFISDRLASQQS